MARKKKAPAVKGNLRNLPDKKQRAIDRFGNIVTMIEVTNGTDIKAYELEPVYQEIGGGGGVDNPVLTINVDATAGFGDIGAIPLLQINDNDLQSLTQMIVGGSTADYSTIVLNYYRNGVATYVWDGNTAYPSITGATNIAVSNEVNCTVTLDQGGGQLYAMITDPTQPASFKLTVS